MSISANSTSWNSGTHRMSVTSFLVKPDASGPYEGDLQMPRLTSIIWQSAGAVRKACPAPQRQPFERSGFSCRPSLTLLADSSFAVLCRYYAYIPLTE